jgi:hypothetical protein
MTRGHEDAHLRGIIVLIAAVVLVAAYTGSTVEGGQRPLGNT